MSDRAEQIRASKDREVQRVERGKVGALPDTFTSDVVGVTFVESYPQNIYDLEALNFGAEAAGEPLTIVIRRNPQNRFDKNACEVHAPALGDDGMIGHLGRPVAARLAPLIDNGEVWAGEVAIVRISEEHLSNPGITVRLKRIS